MRCLFITYSLVLSALAHLTSYAQSPDILWQKRVKTLDSSLTILHNQAMFNGVVLVAEQGTIR